MNNSHSKIEILAPCGSYEILIAAIHAGADACYFGGNCFGARAYAQNFDEDTMINAISYAHLHGVKVYLTVNTLLKQTELSDLYDYIKPFYEAGGDALIVQDLGVFSYIRQQFPDISIHCSTQMNITSRYGAEFMKQQGASRVVTAREMSLDEIRDITQHVDIEVETFVHGAMCYSYSGQCLMSSLAGGRSGNRGRCAQPCRKCYDNSYLLSMKDMCTLQQIPSLIEAGIDSLKIEGRMKNAYYVASAVHAYRTLVDDYQNGCFDFKKAEQLSYELAAIYNRGGFCDGYFFKHNGADMISTERPNNQGVAIGTLKNISGGAVTIKLTQQLYRQDVLELYTKENEIIEITSSKDGRTGECITLNCPKTRQLCSTQTIYRTKCPFILQHVKADYIDNYAKLPVNIAVTAHISAPLQVYIQCELHGKLYEATVTGPVVEPSQRQQASYEQVKKPFAQLGNTEYELVDFTCDIDRDAFLPNSVLKNMRRTVIEQLETTILDSSTRTATDRLFWEDVYDTLTTNMDESQTDTCPEQLLIGVTTYEQFLTLLNTLQNEHIKAAGISVPVAIYQKCKEITPESVMLYAELPHIIHKDFTVDLQEMGIRGIYIRNIDSLAILAGTGLALDTKILCDASLYCYNRLAHAFVKHLFAQPVAFLTPRELKLEELHACSQEPLCLMLYEYQPVMLTANCIQKTKYGCKKKNTVLTIQDDMGNTFYAKTNCKDCYNVIYNKLPYSILDKYKETAFSELHGMGYMIRFTIESEDRIRQILRAYSEHTNGIEKRTSGHLYRGVL